jgi:hypothetical protein
MKSAPEERHITKKIINHAPSSSAAICNNKDLCLSTNGVAHHQTSAHNQLTFNKNIFHITQTDPTANHRSAIKASYHQHTVGL